MDKIPNVSAATALPLSCSMLSPLFRTSPEFVMKYGVQVGVMPLTPGIFLGASLLTSYRVAPSLEPMPYSLVDMSQQYGEIVTLKSQTRRLP
jgi:hypothetical protein